MENQNKFQPKPKTRPGYPGARLTSLQSQFTAGGIRGQFGTAAANEDNKNKELADAGKENRDRDNAGKLAALSIKGKVDGAERKEKPVYNGTIVLRFSPELPVIKETCDSIMEAARQLKLDGLKKVLDRFDLSNSRRLIHAMPMDEVLELERKAAQSELPPLNSLCRYWKLDCREQPEIIDEAVKALNDLFEIDLAYQEFAATDPAVNPGDDPYSSLQGYLDPAPFGINAEWAWTQPNGEGAGVGVVDLEQGWFLGHEDFTSKAPTLLYGTNRDGYGTYKGNHGTAVLGEIIGDDNTVGVVGIAPTAAYAHASSHFDGTTAGHVADAILGALPSMNPGDVLLLEVQKNFLPTETDDADFDAIRLAGSLGIIVVEAAGNGNNNLDTYTNSMGQFTLNPATWQFKESGAIMVGASVSTVPHNRAWFSNYGARVNCYAWGENVVTAGYGNLAAGTGDNETYTDTFGGTSSASPIVTGAAMIVQGMYQANFGTVISPMQMRTILSDPATGTAQGGGVSGNIGVMPNLQLILPTLNLVPDVYIRTALGDNGTVPFTGSGIYQSPDIFIRKNTVANPQLVFGEGSGTENMNTLGNSVEFGQDNYVYTRFRNRGGSDANFSIVSVYWSPPATLVTPSLWNLIGWQPVDVPVGNVLTVADPITWQASNIPSPGHYCLVGIVDHVQDPAPAIGTFPTANDYYHFIRNINNAAWRNINVVDLDPNAMPDPEMSFLITNTPEPEEFDFQIIQRFSNRVRVWLELPFILGKRFLDGKPWKFKTDRERRTMRILLPHAPELEFGNIRLPGDARFQARFHIQAKPGQIRPGNGILINQLFRGNVIGGVEWKFHDRRVEDCILKCIEKTKG